MELMIEQIFAVEPQDVEEERHDRQLCPQRIDVQAPTEASHGDLKRERPLVLVERDDLAVEDQLLRGERAHRLGHFGYSRGDVVQASRVDDDPVSLLVNLDAGTIELPL